MNRASGAPEAEQLQTAGEELIYTPATELLQLFRTRKLSPVEVLKAQIQRFEAVGPKVNPFTFTHFDEALKAAQESEQRYRRGEARPLEGLTVALKDEYEREGWITTAGCKLLKDNVSRGNHPATEKLLQAGAVLHAQTTVPEMFILPVTWSDLWGVTRNPWNLAYTPGGSSGGSAAALAAGTTTLATGSDMGGSIRIPSAFCGLYGFKPPFNRNATEPAGAFFTQAVSGPMARTFGDLVLLQNVMSGPAVYNPSALRPVQELPQNYESIKGWRIAYSMDQTWAEIDDEVRRNTEQALRVLADQGAIVEEVDLKLGLSGVDIRDAILKALLTGPFGADMADLLEHAEHLTCYGRYVATVASTAMGARQARESSQVALKLYAALQDNVFLKGYRALVMPTTGTNHVKADFNPLVDPVSINGKPIEPQAGWLLTPFFNLCSWNPVVAVPTGQTSIHVPTGMQIAAETYDDVTAFRIAAAYARGAEAYYTGKRFPDFRNQP
jgi:Asp-tRNA(Asn)/Glu-tRNA(Gln) amidotransferase A subunit family amidase